MKNMRTVLGVFGLGVVVGSLLGEKAPVAEAGQKPGCAPLLVTGGGVVIQDMNGDGVLDPIAEAVRLLSWAFLGAPAPPAPCDPPELTTRIQELEAQLADCRAELTARIQELKAQLADCRRGNCPGLPDTGQALCYNSSGAVSDCDSATCPGQDGAYATGCPSEGRFTDNGDGTVTDTCTGLIWQKDSADTNGDGQSTDQDFLRWCDALAYCESLSFAGHDDWRLPNVRELVSIVDYGRVGTTIDPVFGALTSVYWSSTTFADGAGSAWLVYFGNGIVSGDDKGNVESSVRAVRSGP